MMRRRSSIKPDDSDSNIELDLAPMLALMVTLIPMMLLATVFVKLSIIDTPLPQLVQQAIEEDRNKKERVTQIFLTMSSKNDFEIQTVVDGNKAAEVMIPRLPGDLWDFDKLHIELVKLKRLHPRLFRVDLKPHGDVPYEDIVQTMDEARSIKKNEVEFSIEDKKTKLLSKTKIMFPDVIFVNVVGG